MRANFPLHHKTQTINLAGVSPIQFQVSIKYYDSSAVLIFNKIFNIAYDINSHDTGNILHYFLLKWALR